MKSEFSRILEISGLARRSLLFCVMPVGIPPHFLNRFQISTLQLASSPQLLQLLAQLLNVIADDAVVNVHIGTVVEHVQTAGNVDFQRRGDELGLLFLLRPESIVQILQDGHILRPGVGEVFLIHQPHTAVNHRFLHRL